MITEQGLLESSAQLLPKDGVLFSSRAPIGYTVIAANKVCTNQGFRSIVPYIEGISEYIYYFLKAQVEKIRARASGTTFKEISGAELGNTIIKLPSLAEQRKIVAAIKSAFHQFEQVIANLS
jgi:type I restriction enzyme S subunit